MNTGVDLAREQAEQLGTEYKVGAASQACLLSIPLAERPKWQPEGELQKGVEDFQDCVTRAFLNVLESKFTRAYQLKQIPPELRAWLEQRGYINNGRVEFSDAFIAILSGTTRTGNSFKAPAHAIHTYGLIPKAMLPANQTMTFDDYHNPNRITPDMRALGKQFIERFTINYEQGWDIKGDLKLDELVVGGYAWPLANNGVYPRSDNPVNHAFKLIEPEYFAFDNYLDYDGDWIKHLASDYRFYDYGYRIYVSQMVVPEQIIPLMQRAITLLKQYLALLLAQKAPEPPKMPVDASKPADPTPAPSQPKPTATGLYKWDTPQNARHSVRLICDEMRLSKYQKDVITACIQQESQFNNKAVGRNMKNGKVVSTDWGLCQINDYWHVGPGKKWASVQQIIDNPEKAVRWMITMYKQGKLNLWVSYSSGAYLKYMPK